MLIILVCSWIVSLVFGVGSVFSNYLESSHSIMVRNNKSLYIHDNSSMELNDGITRRQVRGGGNIAFWFPRETGFSPYSLYADDLCTMLSLFGDRFGKERYNFL